MKGLLRKGLCKFITCMFACMLSFLCAISPARTEEITYPFSVTTTELSDKKFEFTMSAAGTFYVDCGDGGTLSGQGVTNGTETINRQNITTEDTYTCTYTTTTPKTIKFGGLATGYNTDILHSNNQTFIVEVAAISFYNSGDKVQSISGNLSTIFPWYSSTHGRFPMFYQTFKGCVNITSIPEDLFADLAGCGKYMFRETFMNCTGLTSIPTATISGQHQLFSFGGANGPVELGNGWVFVSTFSGCTNLQSIPSDLFSRVKDENGSGSYAFGGTFTNCKALTAIPGTLFSTITKPSQSMFGGTFSDCENITEIPVNLFNFGNVSNDPNKYVSGVGGLFMNTFSGCKSLTTIPSSLFSYVKSSATGMFMGTFSRCTGLQQIPANLFNFAGNYDVAGQNSMFQSTFYNCNNITSIPNELFSHVKSGAQSMFSGTFNGCEKLESIPDDLFDFGSTENDFRNIDGQKQMFEWTFKGCTTLTSIPSGLFSHIKSGAESMFNGTFNGCTGLKYLPENLFASVKTPAEKLFYQTFYGCNGLIENSGAVIPSAEYNFIPKNLFSVASGGNTGLINESNPEQSLTATDMMTGIFYGASLSTQCPADYYQYTTGYEDDWDNQVSCTPCPPGSHSPAGATSVDQCVSGYNVTYNCGIANGNPWVDVNGPYEEGVNVTLPATPGEHCDASSIHREFTGWNCGPSVNPNNNGQFTMLGEPVTCTAQWETCTTGYYWNEQQALCYKGYDINYMAFICNGTSTPFTVYDGVSVSPAPNPGPTRVQIEQEFEVAHPIPENYYLINEGHIFNGWDVTGLFPSGSNHYYSNSQIVIDGVIQPNTQTTTDTSIIGTMATHFKNLLYESGTATFTATWLCDTDNGWRPHQSGDNFPCRPCSNNYKVTYALGPLPAGLNGINATILSNSIMPQPAWVTAGTHDYQLSNLINVFADTLPSGYRFSESWSCTKDTDGTSVTTENNTILEMPVADVTCIKAIECGPGYVWNNSGTACVRVYGITYDCGIANGDLWVDVNGPYQQGDTVTLPETPGEHCDASDSHKVFTEWSCQPSGNSNTNGQFSMPGTGVVCTAQWDCDVANDWYWNNEHTECIKRYNIIYHGLANSSGVNTETEYAGIHTYGNIPGWPEAATWGNGQNHPEYYESGTATPIGVPTREHYVFAGWCVGAVDCNDYAANVDGYTIPATQTGDIDLYARWNCDTTGANSWFYWNYTDKICVNANKYTISYQIVNPPSGVVQPESEQVAAYFSHHKLPSIPMNNGYTCSDWVCKTDPGDENVPVSYNMIAIMPVSDVQCTSTCGSNQIGLNWNPNNGGNSIENTCSYQTGFINLDSVRPVRPGYTFEGWKVVDWDSSQSEKCTFVLSDLDATQDGIQYWAKSINRDGTDYCGWNISCDSSSSFNELQQNEWKVHFDWGDVYGISKISETGNYMGEAGFPSDNPGIYCWCKVTGFKPNGGDKICEPLENTAWVATWNVGIGNAKNCADFCGMGIETEFSIRNNAFKVFRVER